ncbi:MAG: hypothetical protein HQ582_16410, partial [Planctomycetes bacterium]|nr:hypothetical protein [Planctomycetota bacterium]
MTRFGDGRRFSGRPAGRWLVALLVVLACVLVCVGEAEARVGGGGSFSGGGGGFGGGGGGFGGGSGFSGGGGFGGGPRLHGGGRGGTLSWPWVIGIFIVILFLALTKARVEKNSDSRRYTSTHTGPASTQYDSGRRSMNVRQRLEELRRHDPNFSEILFMDFACALYTRVQEARGRGDLEVYGPYLAPMALKELQGLGGGLRDEVREFVRTRGGAAAEQPKFDVRGVIVGGAEIKNVTDPEREKIAIAVGLETNYTEAYGEGDAARENAFYSNEVWTFTRRRDVLSRPPEMILALGCPNCGSTAERRPDDSCG